MFVCDCIAGVKKHFVVQSAATNILEVTMADQASSGAATTAASVASAPARSQDPAWAHGQVIIGNRNSTLCLHYNKRINSGGITRFKYHLAGV